MKVYTEARAKDVTDARAIVFLADVQDALLELRVHGLKLELQVIPAAHWASNPRQYIIARNRDGEEITSLDSDNKGQHGHFIHPGNGTGTPKAVAASIANDLKWFTKRKAQFGDGHRTY